MYFRQLLNVIVFQTTSIWGELNCEPEGLLKAEQCDGKNNSRKVEKGILHFGTQIKRRNCK